MILHYLRISLRNLRKYKTQTAISIAAMAVSLTLMGMVSSVMLMFKSSPFLHQPYSNRIEKLSYAKDGSTYIDYVDLELIKNHHFKNAEETHYVEGSTYFMNVTSDPGSDDQKSLSSLGTSMDSEFIKFVGAKSAISGETIKALGENEVIITDWLAKKLFKDADPIGRYINLEFSYYDGTPNNQNYLIRDVVESQYHIYSPLPSRCHVFFPADHLTKESKANCFFILKEGASRDSLLDEIKEIIPEGNAELRHLSDFYNQEENRILTIRNFVILFLFLFVLLSFSNYLRQQTQLFRLREREVALRTCVGGNHRSLFFLFATEIMIVLLLTLAIAVALVCIVNDYFVVHFGIMLDNLRIDFNGAVLITVITSFILIVISLIVVAFTIRRIRRNQTGLALRMKPQPKHRIRNIGLTVQLSISILFIWISVLFCISIKGIREDLGIPDNVEKLQSCLTIVTNGISKEESDEINAKIESLPSIEKIYRFYRFTTYFNPEAYKSSSQFMVFFQTANDVEDFFELEVKELRGSVNPDKYVLINEEFKKMLVDQNLWNGKTVTLPFNGNEEYEVRGIFEGKTLSNQFTEKTVIVKDASMPDSHFNHIILPKKGMESETKDEIKRIFKEVAPSRIDLSVENWFDYMVPNYSMFMVMIVIISILSVISVITTMACIYSAVALDTRRRRKEMALRKLNGATRKVIAMIFARTYIWIIGVAILLTVPMCIIIFDSLSYPALRYIGIGSTVMVYLISVLFVIAIAAATIFWKIRDIMNSDPIEYLKE